MARYQIRLFYFFLTLISCSSPRDAITEEELSDPHYRFIADLPSLIAQIHIDRMADRHPSSIGIHIQSGQVQFSEINHSDKSKVIPVGRFWKHIRLKNLSGFPAYIQLLTDLRLNDTLSCSINRIELPRDGFIDVAVAINQSYQLNHSFEDDFSEARTYQFVPQAVTEIKIEFDGISVPVATAKPVEKKIVAAPAERETVIDARYRFIVDDASRASQKQINDMKRKYPSTAGIYIQYGQIELGVVNRANKPPIIPIRQFWRRATLKNQTDFAVYTRLTTKIRLNDGTSCNIEQIELPRNETTEIMLASTAEYQLDYSFEESGEMKSFIFLPDTVRVLKINYQGVNNWVPTANTIN